MARICYDHPYINVAQASVLQAGSTTVYQPDYKPGAKIKCDSGVYRYLKANGAVQEGGLAKYVATDGTSFDATPLTTAISGTVKTDGAVCVTSGGLADNQYGWFWLGEGEEYVYCANNVVSLLILATCTSAGCVAGQALSGDVVSDLIAIDSSSATGLRYCRSSRLLSTNFEVAVA